MKKIIKKLLEEEVPDIDFEASDSLVEDGMIDSLGITAIISALSVEFGINIPYDEIIEENFNSLDSIVAMVERLTK